MAQEDLSGPIIVVYIRDFRELERDEMSNSDVIRKYFSAYENRDRKAVESLLTDDFVFTSPYDYRHGQF